MAPERIDRRQFIVRGATGVAGLWLLSSRLSAFAQGERPNILWLVTEDNNPYLGCYGDPVARTPTLDRLAAEGIRYDTFMTAAPVCAPSRFAILTGMHPESCAPAQHMRAQGKIPDWLVGFPSYLKKAGYYTTNNAKTDYNAPIDNARAGWNESSYTAHWRNRPAGAPFFAVFNFDTTHETAMAAPATVQTDPASVRVPRYLPDTPIIRNDRAHYYDVIALTDALIAQRLQELEDDGVTEDTIVVYYGDNGGVLPRSKRFCFDSGLHAPLIVRFPPKWAHLAPAGPGSSIASPVSGVDLGPTMLSLLGLGIPAYMQGRAFLGAAASTRRYAFSMRNRMDERYDMQRTVRDERYRYIRNYMPHLVYGQHVLFMWTQAGYREWEQRWLDGALDEVQSRFWREKPAEELYDLHADPDEVSNLAGDPGHASALHRMRAALDAHMIEINDNGFIPESSPLEGYEESRAQGAYPIRKAMALAETAIAREAGGLSALVAALGDPNETIRYWGALGCCMLGGAAAQVIPVLESRLADPSIPVRVAAAEALGRIGVLAEALPLLSDIATSSPDVRHRLQALNALTNLGQRARSTLPAFVRASADPDEYIRDAGLYGLRMLTRTYAPAP